MTENLKVGIAANDRAVDFVLTFDPSFVPDRNMRLVIERDKACEPEVVHLMTRVLHEGDVAIDGGANVGFFTCLMSCLVGNSGMVYAVEPTPFNQTKIEHNLANNRMRNVYVVKQALYDRSEEMVLHMAHDTGYNSLAPHSDSVGKQKVTSTTIDEILDGDRVRLIKLDIEGAELAALTGAVKALQGRPKPYVTCEFNTEALQRFGASPNDLRHLMMDAGYECFLLNTDGTLPRHVPFDTQIVSRKQNLMVLFSTVEQVAQAWPEVQYD